MQQAVRRIAGVTDPLEVLREVGGSELVAIAAAVVAARHRSLPVVLDGYVVTASVLPLVLIAPRVLDHCTVGHCSAEPGHRLLLDRLGKRPLLDLDMRLGEGSGAMAAVPLIAMACAGITEVPTIAEWFGDRSECFRPSETAWPSASSMGENGVGPGCARFTLVRGSPDPRLMPGVFPAPRIVVTYTPHRVVDRLTPPDPSELTDLEGVVMDIVVERCAGVDVGKSEVTACVRTPVEGGRRDKRTRTFSTFTADLEAMADWFAAEGVTAVVMEATGSFWKPVWYVLEDRGFELMLVNVRHVKFLPGRKSDVLDAEWLAELLEHGLLRGSFVPPVVIRQLRDLTRYRKRLVQAHTSEGQRIEKTLEDAGIKLDVVASDILGVSGRLMLKALVAGERDPEVLAEHAKRQLRKKIPQLRQALRGRFAEHHALLIGMSLDHLEYLEAATAKLDSQIDTLFAGHTSDAGVPFAQARDRLDTITGVGQRAAECIIAEIGLDMSRFPTAGHLASWAGVAPGTNITGGKRRSSKTTEGDKWLVEVVVECAWAAARSHDTYLSAQFWRLARRIGKKKAALAVAHSILVISWHLLTTNSDYDDLGGDYFTRHDNPERRRDHHIRQLQDLGYRVILQPIAVSPRTATRPS